MAPASGGSSICGHRNEGASAVGPGTRTPAPACTSHSGGPPNLSRGAPHHPGATSPSHTAGSSRACESGDLGQGKRSPACRCSRPGHQGHWKPGAKDHRGTGNTSEKGHGQRRARIPPKAARWRNRRTVL